MIPLFILLSTLNATAANPEVGDKVFVKDGAIGKAGHTKVDADQFTYPATVEDINGDQLWLTLAWVHKRDVMTVDEALKFYDEQIEREPFNASAWRLRGSAWETTGDFDQAQQDYTEAIRLDPGDTLPYINRGNNWYVQGKYAQAIADYNQAILAGPTEFTPYSNRAGAWLAMGQLTKAVADFSEAIRLNEKDAHSYIGRGLAWYRIGDDKKAIKDYETAIRLQPKSSDGYCGLAWIMAAGPDAQYRNGKKAVQLATTACELTKWNDANNVAVLAVAYAESADWENCLKWQRQYIEMVPTENEKRDGQARLELYLQNRPYRDSVVELPQKPVPIGQSIGRNLGEIIIGSMFAVMTYVVVLILLAYRRDQQTARQNKAMGEPNGTLPKDNALEIVTVARFQSLPEAEACKLRLESEGLTVFLADAETIRTDWLLSGAIGAVKIQVPSTQVETAAKVLGQIQHPPAGQRQPADDNLCLACGLVMPEEALQCPACGWSYAGENNEDAETIEAGD